MSYTITCPYCFKKMQDNEVSFRSALVNQGDPGILPDEYDDPEDFNRRYRGPDKEEILQKYRDWAFFAEAEDPIYEDFWKKYGGTTESDPAASIFNVESHHRRVIDPSNPYHQKYLKRQPDDTFLIRDADDMVAQIELLTGERCNRRVCKHCHNPLPDGYGKNTVKFVSLIGITGSGKTVYLAQLLRHMANYTVKVGLSAKRNAAGVLNFLEKNPVKVGVKLPGSTPAKQLQQPLFYTITRSLGNDYKSSETFVLYDVPGEVFKDGNDGELVYAYAPFIEHADAAIVLIDPLQFEAVSDLSASNEQHDDPTVALNTIQNIVSNGDSQKKCKIPFAICVSKADMGEFQSVLDPELRSMLLEDVKGIQGSDGFYKPIFNAQSYAPIGKALSSFIMANNMNLATTLRNGYASYAFFALTALGCPVDEQNQPIGPILPKRVEEPIYWLFYKLGYVSKNGSLPWEIKCPRCGSEDTYELPPEEQEIVERYGPFGILKRIRYVNRCCRERDCGYRWEYTPED